MNFFKKNLLVVAPLIIATFLLSMIPCVGGLQDMTRSHKLRGAAKSGAAAEFFLPPSSSATRFLYHQPQQHKYAPPTSGLSNSFRHTPAYYQDHQRQEQGADVEPDESTSSHTSPEVTRVYRLYNLRSSSDILIQDNKVSATGTKADEKGDLGLESVLKGNVVRTRIRGILSDKYICFNKKGRLVLRPKKKARGDKCEFIEESTTAGSRFRSVLEPRWHIGFTTAGHSLNGAAYDPNQSATFACPSCFLFLKTSTYLRDKYPKNYTQHNFDPFSHNRAIGQFHPGLHPEEFLSDFKFPFQQTTVTSTQAPAPTSQPMLDPAPSAPQHHHHHRHPKHPYRRRRKNKQSKSSSLNSIRSSSSPKESTEPRISISSKYNIIPDSQNNSISRISYNAVPINQLIYNSSLVSNRNSNSTAISGRTDDSSRQGGGVRELPEPQEIQFVPPSPAPSHLPPVQTLPRSTTSTSILPPSTTISSPPPRNIARLRKIKKTHRKPNQALASSSRQNNSSTGTPRNSNSNYTTPATTTTSRRTTTTTVPTTTTERKATTSAPSFSKPTTRRRRRHRHHHHYSQRNQTTTATPATSTVLRTTVTVTPTTFAPQIAEFMSKFPRWR